MKKNTASIKIIVAIAALVGLYFVYKYIASEKNLERYVPKDALVVAKLDLKSIGQKIKFNELVDFKSYKNVLKELNSDSKSLVENIFQKPQESGISLLQSPCLFAVNTSKDEVKPIFCLTFGISNKEKFTKFFENLTNDEFEVNKGEPFFTFKIENDLTILYNDKVAFLMGGVDEDDISYKKIATGFLELSKSESILSNESYNQFQKNNYDFNFFINRKAIEKLADLSTKSEQEVINSFLNLNYLGFGVSFEEDMIRLKSFVDPEQKNEAPYLKNTGLSSSGLKFLSPNGNPYGFLSMNLDLTALYKYAVKSLSGEDSDVFEEISSKLGMTTDEMFKIFNGEMSVSFSDVVLMPAYPDELSYSVDSTLENYSVYKEPVPVFVGHAKISNTTTFDQLINNSDLELQNENGIYSAQYDTWRDRSFYFGRKGDDFLISNNKVYLENFVNGSFDWKSLAVESAREMSTANPLSCYLDLRYSTYRNLIENELKNELSTSETELLTLVLKNFKSIQSYSNKDGGAVEISMDSRNLNSLWRIFLMVEDLYKKSI